MVIEAWVTIFLHPGEGIVVRMIYDGRLDSAKTTEDIKKIVYSDRSE